jgi:hypothetical protein
MKFSRVPLSRLVLRVIVSALGAAAIAFGSTLSAALVQTGEMKEGTYWIVLAAVVGAIGKDIQSNLSHPPGSEHFERRAPEAPPAPPG